MSCQLSIVNPSGETRAARFATYLTLLASAHLIISKFALHPSNKIRELHNWRLRPSFFLGNSRCRAYPDANVSGGSKTVEWLWRLNISTGFLQPRGRTGMNLNLAFVFLLLISLFVCFFLFVCLQKTWVAAQKWRRQEANSRFLPSLSKMLQTMSAWWQWLW